MNIFLSVCFGFFMGFFNPPESIIFVLSMSIIISLGLKEIVSKIYNFSHKFLLRSSFISFVVYIIQL